MTATGRRLLRMLLVMLHVLAGIGVAWLVLRPRSGRGVSTRPMVIWSRLLCRILGVRLLVSGTPRAGATLFVANHISWLDIFCIAAVCPTHFLAKSEVATWPVIGWLCQRTGTAFIRRGEEQGAGEAAGQLAWRLRQGGRLLIFPEGTSTTGEAVRRFYPRLFQAAIHTHCPVQAIALRYPAGEGINPVIPFVGDDALLSHLWRLLGERRIMAELYFCEPLQTFGQSRDMLARKTQSQIDAALRAPLPGQVQFKPRSLRSQ
jgi:1-acyl-sn-glycerol-3-phosphate acyltransferase